MHTDQPLFSILIPSWNNLDFLKLCVESIRKHSAFPHQIIVHINDGSDGTLEWVRNEGLDYTWSEKNIGVCLAMNMMRSKVKTDYILFINDDMYVLPGWDTALYDEIKRLPDNRFFLSATTIQEHPVAGPVILANYGHTVKEFRREALLKEYADYEFDDWTGSTLPPNIVHRDIWDLVGGYSVEFSPGMYSDPDFTAKLWFCGVRYMKGLSASRVYHFETKTTTRIRRNDGRMQFLLKWGVTAASFRRIFTHSNQPGFDASRFGSFNRNAEKSNRMRCRLMAIKTVIAKGCGPLWKFSEKSPADDKYEF